MGEYHAIASFLMITIIMVVAIRGKHNRLIARLASVCILYGIVTFTVVGQDYRDANEWLTQSASLSFVIGLVLTCAWMFLDVLPIYKKWIDKIRSKNSN
jgi:peptidoglycan/LPS O-acetylase OafA/YrhL